MYPCSMTDRALNMNCCNSWRFWGATGSRLMRQSNSSQKWFIRGFVSQLNPLTWLRVRKFLIVAVVWLVAPSCTRDKQPHVIILGIDVRDTAYIQPPDVNDVLVENDYVSAITQNINHPSACLHGAEVIGAHPLHFRFERTCSEGMFTWRQHTQCDPH